MPFFRLRDDQAFEARSEPVGGRIDGVGVDACTAPLLPLGLRVRTAAAAAAPDIGRIGVAEFGHGLPNRLILAALALELGLARQDIVGAASRTFCNGHVRLLV